MREPKAGGMSWKRFWILIIKDTTVLTMDRRYSVLEHVDVAVQGNRIVSVNPTNPATYAHKTLSGSGYLLMPGFVNTHTHVGMAYFKGTAAGMELFKWLAWGWFYIQRIESRRHLLGGKIILHGNDSRQRDDLL